VLGNPRQAVADAAGGQDPAVLIANDEPLVAVHARPTSNRERRRCVCHGSQSGGPRLTGRRWRLSTSGSFSRTESVPRRRRPRSPERSLRWIPAWRIRLASMRRTLSERERALLLHIIDLAGDEDREALRQQADAAVVTGHCGCGCPTVDLEVEPGRSTPIDGRRLVFDAWWTPADDRQGGGVLMFVIDGWLSLLEVWWTDDTPPSELPPPREVFSAMQSSFHRPVRSSPRCNRREPVPAQRRTSR
jgi:hypothetical protein